MKRILFVVFGLLTVYFGVSSLLGNTYVRGVPIHSWVGYIEIVGGISFVLWGVFAKKRTLNANDIYLVCLNCQTPCRLSESNKTCPDCGGKLVDLEGYKEKHSEQAKPLGGDDFQGKDTDV